MNSSTRTTAILLFFLALGAGIVFVGRDKPLPPVDSTGSSNSSATTISDSNIKLEKIERPNLDKKLIFPAGMSDASKRDAQTKLRAIIEALKARPTDAQMWNDLGLYRKLIEDYQGAREAWEYAALLLPTWSPPYSNLANLYTFEIKDLAKAEGYYAQAIETDPQILDYYYHAHDFYIYHLKDVAKARAVLELGIKNIDDKTDIPLREMLAELK